MTLTVVSLAVVAVLTALVWWRLSPVERPPGYPQTLLGLDRRLDQYGGRAVEELDDAAGLNLPIQNAELLVYAGGGREIRLWVGYTDGPRAAASALASLRRNRPGEPLHEGVLPPPGSAGAVSGLYFRAGSRFFWLRTNFPLASTAVPALRREILVGTSR